MRVTINQDEKTATDRSGRILKIKGLIIRKSKSESDAFYDEESSICKAVVYKGLSMEAIDLGNGEIHLL